MSVPVSVLVLGLVVVLGSGPATAQPRSPSAPALTATLAPGVTIDWTRGAVIARGIGPADRHAPEPAVARVAAERRAVDQARSRLAAALDLIPRTGPALTAEARAALAREVALAPIVGRVLGTDGSAAVEVGLGLEALHQAVVGLRVLTAGGDDGAPTLVVVDARPTAVRPTVGLAITFAGAAAGASPWTGPLTYAVTPPAGSRPRAVTAAIDGNLTLDGAPPPAGARVVVVVTQPP